MRVCVNPDVDGIKEMLYQQICLRLWSQLAIYSDPEAQVTPNVTQLVMSEALEWLIILNIAMWSL